MSYDKTLDNPWSSTPSGQKPDWSYSHQAESIQRTDKWAEPNQGTVETNIVGGVFLMCATILGAGILAIPHNLDLLGMGVGIVFLLLFSALSVYSIWMMLKAGEVSGEKTYENMVEASVPGFGRAITSVFVLVLIFGALSGFLVIIGDIFCGNNGIIPSITSAKEWYTDRPVLMLVFTTAFIFPLSMLRNISKLEYSSFAAVLIIVFFTGVVITLGIKGLSDGTATMKGLNWAPANYNNFFNALPVFALAFTCQMNVYPIWAELHNPTVKRMNIVNIASMCLSSSLYLLVGFFGYIVYPSAGGNILESLPGTIFYTVLRSLFVFAILFHYPVVHFSFRATLEKVVFAKYEFNAARHWIETIIVISLTLMWSILFPSLQDVFSLTGSLAAFPICFIIPSFCYIRLVHFKFADEPVDCSFRTVWHKLPKILLPGSVIVLGSAVMVVAVYTSIVQLITDAKKH